MCARRAESGTGRFRTPRRRPRVDERAHVDAREDQNQQRKQFVIATARRDDTDDGSGMCLQLYEQANDVLPAVESALPHVPPEHDNSWGAVSSDSSKAPPSTVSLKCGTTGQMEGTASYVPVIGYASETVPSAEFR